MDELSLVVQHHVDVGIADPSEVSPADHNEPAIAFALVAQVMTVGGALGPGRAIAGTKTGCSIIFDQCGFALEHDKELVFAIVPMPV